MSWWMWLAGGLVLMVAELATPSGFYLLFFGLGAFGVALLAGAGVLTATGPQLLAFTVLSLTSLVLFRGPVLAVSAAALTRSRPAGRQPRHSR